MDRLRSMRPADRAAVLTAALLAMALAGWAAGWAWLAVPGALGAFGTAAVCAGTDSRAPGDWRRTAPR